MLRHIIIIISGNPIYIVDNLRMTLKIKIKIYYQLKIPLKTDKKCVYFNQSNICQTQIVSQPHSSKNCNKIPQYDLKNFKIKFLLFQNTSVTTVGIQIMDQSGIHTVKTSLIVEWFSIQPMIKIAECYRESE